MIASPVVLSTAIVTILALIFYFYTGIVVARMRYKHGVKAPAITGPLEFECAMRVQMNTLEHVPIFLPALWLAAIFFSPFPLVAPILGIAWIAGRFLYLNGYLKAPEKRGLGFGISAISEMLLLILAFVGVMMAWAVVA